MLLRVTSHSIISVFKCIALYRCCLEIQKQCGVFKDSTINHCLVNEYCPGQGILPHKVRVFSAFLPFSTQLYNCAKSVYTCRKNTFSSVYYHVYIQYRENYLVLDLFFLMILGWSMLCTSSCYIIAWPIFGEYDFF